MDARFNQILKIVEQSETCTAQTLSRELNVSVKTVRNLIKELNQILVSCGAEIRSKNGVGYYLIIDDTELFKASKTKRCGLKTRNFASKDNRKMYLINTLLTTNEYMKIDDLCEKMYISRRTLSNDLKDVEKSLNSYNLELFRKPNYGIKVMGNEIDFRLCLANCEFERSKSEVINSIGNFEINTREISDIISEVLHEMCFDLSDISFQNLVVHIYIAIHRMKDNNYIPMQESIVQDFIGTKEYDVANQISKRINEKFGIVLPTSEIGYFAIHLAGKKMIRSDCQSSDNNLVISQEVISLAKEMIQAVYKAFQLDFRSDLEILMSLSQHIMPLIVRLKYDMIARNHLLQDIKKHYSFAYTIATFASTVITEKYGKELDENEVGFIALTFALAIERQNRQISRKNIIIVCSSGKGSAQLLEYKCMQEFGEYINRIKTCNGYELDTLDFSEYDYIFTTIPIQVSVPIPILEVKYFLEETDVLSAKALLSKNSVDSVTKYYDPMLFLPSIHETNKVDVLKRMCSFVSEIKGLPDTFYESVLKRERLAKTEFGNNVAMPHPYQAIGEETFVCVGILDSPVLWGERYVEAVFLVCIENKRNNEINRFLQVTANMLMDKQYISEIINKRSYETLRSILMKIEAG